MIFNHLLLSSKLLCFPKTPEIPAANPPIIPEIKSNKVEFPLSFNNVAILFASMKSLLLLSVYDCIIHNKQIAKKGIKNTAPFFNGIKYPEIKAAIIIDHQGKYNDNT